MPQSVLKQPKGVRSPASPSALLVQGGRPLHGEVVLRGAKNSASKVMIVALLSEEPSAARNVPQVEDTKIAGRLIEAYGGRVAADADRGLLEIDAKNLHPAGAETLTAIAGKKSRIPILFAGPLLVRCGEAVIPPLGGCEIGPRPIDFHLEALRKMGAVVENLPGGGVRLTAKKLSGAKIDFPYPSVGATEQVLFASVLAEGVTEIGNAAVEPEILDLISVLQKMGATISVGAGRTIAVSGVKRLHGFDHIIPPDRIEAASWASAAAATDGKIFVRNARQQDLMTFLNKLRAIGGAFEVQDGGILFFREGTMKPIALETDVHPGFMTDWQQPFTVALTQAEGVSIIHETVYESRFNYVEALQKMGARIQLFRECLGGSRCRFGAREHLHSAVVVGKTPLYGADITIPDLRAGFSYVIAALAAEGTSTIRNVSVIDRGYENFLGKLRALGADVKLD